VKVHKLSLNLMIRNWGNITYNAINIVIMPKIALIVALKTHSRYNRRHYLLVASSMPKLTSVALCPSHCQTMGTTIYLATRVNCRFLLSSVLADRKTFLCFRQFCIANCHRNRGSWKCCGKTHKKTDTEKLPQAAHSAHLKVK